MSLFRPSMNHFREWIERMQSDESIPGFHYQQGPDIAPYFTHATYRDYGWVFEVNGRLILCYGEGGMPDNSGATMFSVRMHEYSDHHPNEDVFIAARTINGVHSAVDLRYARYVEWNEEERAWDTVEPAEGEPTANQLLMDYFGIESFLREYTPPTVEDIMRQEWANKRDREIRRANRQISVHVRELQQHEAGLANARAGLLRARADLNQWGHMTLDKFMESVDDYKDQLEGITGSIDAGPGQISVKTKPFELQGITLGPFQVTYNLATSEITVSPLTGAARSNSDHYHPHVERNGKVCWGEDRRVFENAMSNPFEALLLAVDFLRTGYFADGAYCRLSGWRNTPSWFCENCDEYHDDGQTCPNECGECNQHVNWDFHMFCQIHSECYNNSPEEPGGCASCAREEEERRQQKEAEAAAAAAEEEAAAAAAEEETEEEPQRKRSKRSSKKKTTKKKKKKSTKKKKKKVAKRTSRSVPARAA